MGGEGGGGVDAVMSRPGEVLAVCRGGCFLLWRTVLGLVGSFSPPLWLQIVPLPWVWDRLWPMSAWHKSMEEYGMPLAPL
jgi:hypothetical protein